MLLYHVTPTRNVPSIAEGGIDPAYAQGDAERSYYVTPGGIEWAIAHVQVRHNVLQSAVTVISVNIPRSRLTRFRRGVWYCTEIVYAKVLNER